MHDLTNDIWNIVQATVAEVLSVDPAQLSPQTVLKDVGAQSFDYVDVVTKLEHSFNVGMPRELAIPGSQSLQSYVTAVAARVGHGANSTT